MVYCQWTPLYLVSLFANSTHPALHLDHDFILTKRYAVKPTHYSIPFNQARMIVRLEPFALSSVSISPQLPTALLMLKPAVLAFGDPTARTL